MMTRSEYFTKPDWPWKLLKLLDEALTITPRAEARHAAEKTITPEDTLRAAEEVPNKRQADYQRRMSSLLAGRPE
jgi:hypothetical protein